MMPIFSLYVQIFNKRGTKLQPLSHPLRAELDRQRALDATAKYIDQLADDVDEPSQSEYLVVQSDLHNQLFA